MCCSSKYRSTKTGENCFLNRNSNLLFVLLWRSTRFFFGQQCKRAHWAARDNRLNQMSKLDWLILNFLWWIVGDIEWNVVIADAGAALLQHYIEASIVSGHTHILAMNVLAMLLSLFTLSWIHVECGDSDGVCVCVCMCNAKLTCEYDVCSMPMDYHFFCFQRVICRLVGANFVGIFSSDINFEHVRMFRSAFDFCVRRNKKCN